VAVAQVRAVTVTGERAVTGAGGFNPSWQRHRANYALTVGLLEPGRVLDLGCGVGHSIDLLGERESVGVDRDAESLAGQPRETVVADMRSLPFADDSFPSIICSHALEHVPDPERVLAEAARVLAPDGVAVFTTPNRLTFARADEIIDPYHYVEWDPEELRALCERRFGAVEIHGVFGSERYERFHAEELEKLDRLLRLDRMRLRRLVPRRLRQRLYDRRLTSERADPDPDVLAISLEDFSLGSGRLERCLDLVAVCRAAR
jgi:SAM-dependent methyltransferase